MPKTKITAKADFSKLKAALDDLKNKTGLKIVENAVENAPVDTGNYRSEIRYDGANTVTANAKYSAAIEYGVNSKFTVKEHERVRGKNISIVKTHEREVHRKPNPVMRNAAAKVQKDIPKIWQEALKENGL